MSPSVPLPLLAGLALLIYVSPARADSAVNLLESAGASRDRSVVVDMYRAAAEQCDHGAAEACYTVAAALKGPLRSPEGADRLIRRACDLGYSFACSQLLQAATPAPEPAGDTRLVKKEDEGDTASPFGVPEKTSVGKAETKHTGAAEQGDADAQFNLGLLHYNGKGVRQDFAQARKWYLKAAEQGHADAQTFLAAMDFLDRRLEAANMELQDNEKRNESDRSKIAALESELALAEQTQEEVGREIAQKEQEKEELEEQIRGAGTTVAEAHQEVGAIQQRFDRLQQEKQGVRQQLDANERALGETYFDLGAMSLQEGVDHPRDLEKAREFFLSAAEANHAKAQYNLGIMYSQGLGGPQDFAEARKWSLMAAEQGLAEAQYLVGAMYVEGDGGPQDKAEGQKWLLKAAEQGFADASFLLGMESHFFNEDYKASYVWFDVSASQAGLTFGYESARNNRDLARAKLNPASLAEARTLSRQYHQSYVEPFQ